MIKRGPGIDPQLQLNKAENIRLACSKMNGLIVNPGETFSFWRTVGKPADGKVYTALPDPPESAHGRDPRGPKSAHALPAGLALSLERNTLGTNAFAVFYQARNKELEPQLLTIYKQGISTFVATHIKP